MLHPSYSDLIETANKDVEPGEQPIVQSRYSIVLAAAKRARQLVSGDDALVSDAEGKKPLSVAVEELSTSAVKILRDDAPEETGEDCLDPECETTLEEE